MHICILINTLSRRVSFGLLHVIIIFDTKPLFDGEDIVYDSPRSGYKSTPCYASCVCSPARIYRRKDVESVSCFVIYGTPHILLCARNIHLYVDHILFLNPNRLVTALLLLTDHFIMCVYGVNFS